MDPQENFTEESSGFFGCMLTPGNKILDAIGSKNYARAYSLLNKLEQTL